MRIDQAKNKGISALLSAWGFEPAHMTKGERWYVSPFRPHETEPSFKLTASDRGWYDHGTGMGGDMIEFVQAYKNVSTAKDALAHIRDAFGQPASTHHPRRTRTTPPSRLEDAPALQIQTVRSLHLRPLLTYLEQERGIPRELAKPYLKEAFFTTGDRGRDLYALAFPNESGGYELRNAKFQGVAGKKDISLIKRHLADATRVFEGFMDYLSWLVLENRKTPDCHVLVLNSVAMKARAIEVLHSWDGLQTVHLHLDNDSAGRKLTSDMREALQDVTVIDHAPDYAEHKDLNAYLMAHTKLCAVARS